MGRRRGQRVQAKGSREDKRAMKLATYLDETPRIGVVEGAEIWDLQRLYSRYLFERERLPNCREIAAILVPLAAE